MEDVLYHTFYEIEKVHWWCVARRDILQAVVRVLLPAGGKVLDVGCGTGFFTRYYLERGCAQLTGVDIAPTSIERLSQRHPEAHFLLGDIGADPIDGTFDIVNAFDVLYHITDDARWEKAVGHLGHAVASQGVLLLTDTFADLPRLAEHNVMRPLSRYRDLLAAAGLEVQSLYPTHVLLNRELGPFRPLNRLPGLLYAADRVLLGLGFGHGPAVSKLLVAKRKR
jgi:SAM-dependent methyltransferase